MSVVLEERKIFEKREIRLREEKSRWARLGSSVVFLTLMAVLLTMVALWLKIDHRSPRWDESANLRFSERSNHLIPQGKIFEAWHTEGALRPNMVPFLSALSYYLVGHDTKLAVFLLNGLSLLIISLAIYGISLRLFNSRTGLLACVLFNTYPSIALWSHYYNLDLPLTAYVCLTIWLCIVLTESHFSRTRDAVALGIVLTLGTCSKHMFAPVVAFPLMWLIYQNLSLHGFKFGKAFKSSKAFYFALLAMLISGFGYHLMINHAAFWDGIMRTFFTERSVLKDAGYIPPQIPDKVDQFYEFQFHGNPAHLVLLIAGLVGAMIYRNRLHSLIYIWILSTFLIFVFPVKPTMPYYFYPAMPGVAILSGAWLMGGNFRRGSFLSKSFLFLRVLGAVILSFHFLTQHLEGSLGTRSWEKFFTKAPKVIFASERLTENPFADRRYWEVSYVDGNISALPYPHYWPVQEMLDDVRQKMDENSWPRSYYLGYLTNYEWMTGDFLNYKIWQNHLENRLKYTLPLFPKGEEMNWFFSQDFDFLVLKTGKMLKNDFYGIPWADTAQALVDRLIAEDYQALRDHHFNLIGQYPLPDGSIGTVWASEKKLKSFSLLDSIASAQTSIKRSGVFEPMSTQIGQDIRRTLYHHPIAPPKKSEISWRMEALPNGGSFSFGISLNPDTWVPERGNGVDFTIEVEQAGKRTVLFQRYIDPKNNPEDRKWHDFAIDLPPLEDSFKLILRTESGPSENTAWDHAVWSGLNLVKK